MSKTYKDIRKWKRKATFNEWNNDTTTRELFWEELDRNSHPGTEFTPKLSNHKKIRLLNRTLERTHDENRVFKKWNGGKLIKTGYSWRRKR